MLFMILDLKDMENPEIYQIIFQTYVWYSIEEKLIEENGLKLKQTIGYPALISGESETLFLENELPFQFNSFLGTKMNLSTAPVAP